MNSNLTRVNKLSLVTESFPSFPRIIKEFTFTFNKTRDNISTAVHQLRTHPEIENVTIQTNNCKIMKTLTRVITLNPNRYLKLKLHFKSKTKFNLDSVLNSQLQLRELTLINFLLITKRDAKALANFLANIHTLNDLTLQGCRLSDSFRIHLQQFLEKSHLMSLTMIDCDIIYCKINANPSIFEIIFKAPDLNIVELKMNDECCTPFIINPETMPHKIESLTLAKIPFNVSIMNALVYILQHGKLRHLDLDLKNCPPNLQNVLITILSNCKTIEHLFWREGNDFPILRDLSTFKNLVTLDMGDNKIHVNDWLPLIKFIHCTKTLQRLAFNPNYLNDIFYVKELIDAFRINTSIRNLRFNPFLFWPNTSIIDLFSLLGDSTTLKHLEVSLQTLTKDYSGVVSRGLMHNSTLKTLIINIIEINSTSYDMTKDIIDSIAFNSTLQKLHINVMPSSRMIRQAFNDESALFQGLIYNQTLRSLSLDILSSYSASASLAHALKNNQSLQHLNIKFIGNINCIRDALLYNSTLLTFNAKYISSSLPNLLKQYRFERQSNQLQPLTKAASNCYIVTHHNLPPKDIIPDEVANHLIKAAARFNLHRYFN